MKKLILLAAITILATGCNTTMHEKYKACGWTPDGFNYTFAADHPADGEGLKPAQHYFGLSWNLK